MITDTHIEQWMTDRNIADPAIREMVKQGLCRLRDEGRLRLQSVGVKTRMTIEKFDHERGPDPVLIERLVREESL